MRGRTCFRSGWFNRFDVKNQKWRKVDQDLGAVGYLTWSHDSSWVNFDTSLSKEPGYYRLRVSDFKLEKLVDFGKTRLFPGQFGGSAWTVRCSRATSARKRSTRLTFTCRELAHFPQTKNSSPQLR